MKYASIRELDISNGEGIGISLFVQGCSFHCKGCFNQDTWDFNGGNEWTKEVENKFLDLASRPYIKRISILGGEPLDNKNVEDLCSLINKIKFIFPDKAIWLFTGFKWNQILYPIVTDDFNLERGKIINCRRQIAETCDVVVDGQFEEDKRDLTLKFRGSTNQRVIDVQESLKQNKVVLYCD